MDWPQISLPTSGSPERVACDPLLPPALPPIAPASSGASPVPSPPKVGRGVSSFPPAYPFPPAVDVSDGSPSPPRHAAISGPKLKRFGLHFSPPGLALEYELYGERLFKHLDLVRSYTHMCLLPCSPLCLLCS